MSVETITTILSATGILIALGSGFGWMIHRSDAQSQQMEQRLGTRIDSVEQKLDRVEHEIVEVKIAVARIEGPPRRLLTSS